MAPRPKIALLPESVRDELNAKLKGCAFGNVRGLSEWLKDQGYDIGPTAVYHWAKDLEAEEKEMAQDVERSTRLAKMLVSNSSDEGGALMEASERLAGDGLLRLQLALRKMERDGDIDPVEMAKMLPSITRAIADLNRSGIARSKWQAETKAKLERLEKEAEAGGDNPRKLDPATLAAVRREVYGLA